MKHESEHPPAETMQEQDEKVMEEAEVPSKDANKAARDAAIRDLHRELGY